MRCSTIWIFCCCLCLNFWSTEAFAQRKKNKGVYNYLSKTKTPEEILAIPNKLERIYYTLCGEFHSKAQADTTKIPFMKAPQHILMLPIWQDERKGEYWLYFGWFRMGEPKKAFGQGVFKIYAEKDKSDNILYKMSFYALPNEAEHDYYSEEWKKPKPFAHLKPRDLVQTQNCAATITPIEGSPNEYEFAAPPCKFKLSEQIQYFAMLGRVSPYKQNLFTEYYDNNQKLLFGYPRPDGVILMRQDKKTPVYAP